MSQEKLTKDKLIDLFCKQKEQLKISDIQVAQKISKNVEHKISIEDISSFEANKQDSKFKATDYHKAIFELKMQQYRAKKQRELDNKNLVEILKRRERGYNA